MREFYNTLTPYKKLPHNGIQYAVCRDFPHISRYRRLRQVTHNPQIAEERFITLETPNPFNTHIDVLYYDVRESETNRLDLIAYNHLGSANYAWLLAYINGIEDGFSVSGGQRLMIPKSLESLFQSGEILSSTLPTSLNLGTE